MLGRDCYRIRHRESGCSRYPEDVRPLPMVEPEVALPTDKVTACQIRLLAFEWWVSYSYET